MPTQLTDLVVDYVSLVDRAAVRDPINQSEPMRFVLFKRDHHTHEGDRMTPEEQKAALEKAQADQKAAETEAETAKADLSKAQEQIETLTKSVDELKKAAGEKEEPKAIDKSELDPAVRDALEKSEQREAEAIAKAAEAEKRANDAAERAEKAEDSRLTREFIGKAEDYKALVVKADTFGPVLKEASEKLSKESYDEIERVLKAADEGLQKGDLFKTLGGDRTGDATDALGEAQRKAEELRKSDSTLSASQALEKALDADPELQARYLDEVRGR